MDAAVMRSPAIRVGRTITFLLTSGEGHAAKEILGALSRG